MRAPLGADALRRIVARASTPFERAKDAFVAHPTHSEEYADRLMGAWCHLVAGNDVDRFDHRLAAEGWTPARMRELLRGVALTPESPIPEWALRLDELAGAMMHGSYDEGILEARHPFPFEQILAPCVRAARAQVEREAGSGWELFESTARRALERSLLARLSDVSARALFVEYTAFRAVRMTGSFGLAAALRGGSEIYDAFIESLRQGGVSSFLEEHAVLARLLAQITDDWVRNTLRFAAHVAEDLPELKAVFGEGRVLGAIVRIDPGLSDPHAGGATVHRIVFESGTTVIYKPKSLLPDAVFRDLVAWLHERGMNPVPPVPRVVTRADHGYAEHLSRRPLLNRNAAERYFQAAGSVIALAYALGGTDFHLENVLATPQGPALIDLEMLLQPASIAPSYQRLGALRAQAWSHFNTSVLGTGLLPAWEVRDDGTVCDLSGLASTRRTTSDEEVWVSPNTDAMSLGKRPRPDPDPGNLPMLGVERLSASAFVDDVVEGFRRTYRLLLASRAELLSDDAPLSRLAGGCVRVLLRNTRVYDGLIRRTFHTNFLKDGAAFFVQLDALSRAYLLADGVHPLWPAVRAEVLALTRLDIPCFHVETHTGNLVMESQGVLEGVYEEPPKETFVRRLNSFCETDLERQVSYVVHSLKARSDSGTRDHAGDSVPEGGLLPWHWEAPLEPSDAIERAERLAREMEDHAIKSKDKDLTWIGLAYNAEAKVYTLSPLGWTHYEGRTGVALFYAALAKVTGNPHWERLSWQAASGVLREARDASRGREELERNGVGGGLGLGSSILGLLLCSDLLECEELLAGAGDVARLVTEGDITGDMRLDLMLGNAGLLLSLCALERRAPADRWRHLARASGEHLLAQRVQASTGHRVWATLDGACLCSFTHGSAGIGWALEQAANVLDEPRFATAAREARDYEDALHSEAHAGWPDPRFRGVGQSLVHPDTWCQGRIGIALARAAQNRDAPGFDVTKVLEQVLRVPDTENDTLCCGVMARTEFLLSAARWWNLPELYRHALQLAAASSQRAASRGGYALTWKDGPHHPGLFQGTAGVGYQLLRLAAPDIVPSLLLWT